MLLVLAAEESGIDPSKPFKLERLLLWMKLLFCEDVAEEDGEYPFGAVGDGVCVTEQKGPMDE